MKSIVYNLIDKHYRAHANELVKKLRNAAGSTHNAEDVVQEAYTRACQYWSSYNTDLAFDAWFNRILTNCLADNMRESRNRGSVDEVMADQDEIAPSALFKLSIEDVRNLMKKEPTHIQYILDLYLFKQYKSKEISEVVEEKHGNVRYIVHQFRKKLKEELGESVDD